MKNSNITKKEKLWRVALMVMIILIITASVIATFYFWHSYKDSLARINTIESNVNTITDALVHNVNIMLESGAESISDLDVGLYSLHDYEEAVPGLQVSIPIETPNKKYEFSDMDISCGNLVADNNLWYMFRLSPYVSPGVRYTTYLRGDKDESHWIRVGTINTGKEDKCATDNTVYVLGFNGLEGYGIGGFMIGDNLEEDIEKMGQPTSFSVSGYGHISGATYDYGNVRVNIIADILRGEIEYVEVERLMYNSYWNGE